MNNLNSQKLLLLSVIFCLVSSISMGQTPAFTRTGDSIKTKDILIVKDFEPVISEAFKISDNPRISDTLKPEVGDLSYELLKKQIPTEFNVVPIKAAVMKGEPLEKLYRAYAKGGYGLYNTALGELYVNNLRSRTKNGGFYAKHLSSNGNIKNVGYSGFSNTNVKAYGKQIFYNKILAGSGSYQHDRYHFYGFDTKNDTLPTDLFSDSLAKSRIQQNFQKLAGEIQFKSYFKDSDLVNFDFNLKAYNLTNSFSENETNIKFTTAVDRFYGDKHAFIDLGVDYNQYKDNIATYNSTLVNFEPAFAMGGEKWQVKAALRTFVNADSITTFKAFPIIHATYNLVGDFMIPYVGLDGGLDRNNYDELRLINPFMQNNPLLAVTNTKYDVYGGVRGQFSSNSSFNLKASQKLVENLPLFINDYYQIIPNRFVVVYDTAEITTLTAEFSYQQRDRLNIFGRGDYFIYSTKHEAKAWHTPSFRASLGAVYDLQDKLVLKTDIYYISNQFAKSFNSLDGEALGYGVHAKELKGLIDINIGAEYRYNKKLSGWISLQNLASIKYERWNYYPTQGFLGMLGFTYSFWSR